MKQEDKEILLRDLCARLPYGVKVQYQVGSQLPSIKIFNARQYDELRNGSYIDDWLKCTFKPYLYPLSSMTEEQKSFFDSKHIEIDDYLGIIALFSDVDCKEWDEVFCWLNKNHFDYRGLIEKGLAKNATGLNIY